MKSVPERYRKMINSVPSVLRAQQNGIALLTLVPFMISGMIFAPWNQEMLQEMARAAPQNYGLVPAIVLVVLTSAALIFIRRADFTFCFVSSLILLAMAVKASPWIARVLGQDIMPGIGFEMFYGLYTLTGILTFASVVLRPTVSAWGFRTVAGVMIFDILMFTFSSGWTILGPLFTAYFPSQISVLICLTALMFFRMIAKLIQENGPTRARTREADPRLLKGVRLTTLRLWWPMPLLFLVSALLYHWLDESFVKTPLKDYLNNIEAREKPSVYPGGDVLQAVGPAPDFDTVEDAANDAIRRLLEKQSAEIRGRVVVQADRMDGTTDSIEREVRSNLPDRFPGTRTSGCGFLDISCYIKNGIKSMINSAYVSGRESMMADLRRKLDGMDEGARRDAAQINRLVDEQLSQLSAQTNRRISDTATGLKYVGWVMLFYGLMILMKSMMIVFARVFYDRVTVSLAQTEEGETIKKVGRMSKKGSRLELARGDGHDQYYVAFRACGNNVVDRRRIPQPTKLVVKRLFSRNLAMCLVDFSAAKGVASCDLIVDPPAQIVQWDLLEEEEVFVDMRTVVGFSRSCRLERHISLSLGALIFGRAIYHSVNGPGRLFLRTESEPLAGADRGTGNIMQGSSLIAWRRDTQFNLVSSLTVSDIFLSGYSVRKADNRGHLVVYDTSQTRRISTTGGILRLARAFLLPI